MKTLLLISTLFLMTTASAFAGVDRVDISPAMLVNLGSGHSGQAMGGALSADLFFNRHFAIRTTLGYTKNRYYPNNLDYGEAQYGFWFSVAPYGEFALTSRLRPYVSVIGTGSGGGSHAVAPGINELAPVNRISPDASSGQAFSLGGTVGTKVGLIGPVALFAEVTHYFYSSVAGADTFDNGLSNVAFNYDWDENPTYLSFGLSYSLDVDSDD